ncbi:type I-E CRISPR-associated protein Cas5/CasD [Vreelandella zhaodongensis]|uniref:type I-E CRISPR-associated protein Cas5/CasD n=1 Tax=Vreelandella zhaodongensis TaxID=1176240 RepID=UPI003EB99441
MNDPYLLLWLEAPLQSWGHDSKFGRRDSLDFPTKSGVMGLLCCALGAGGKQVEWLARWAERDMQVQAYVPTDKQGEALPRQPLMRDFHMIGAGYDLSDPWQKLLEPYKSDGARRSSDGGGVKMTYRYYLQDMAFAVALQGAHEELTELEAALQNPVWDLYLGRKNCVPTEFIAQGIYADEEQAMDKARQLATSKNRLPIFKVLQGEYEGEVLTLNDVPVQFGEHKLYRDRRVTVLTED